MKREGAAGSKVVVGDIGIVIEGVLDGGGGIGSLKPLRVLLEEGDGIGGTEGVMGADELWINEERLIAQHDILLSKSTNEAVGGNGTAADDFRDISRTDIDGFNLAFNDAVAVHGLNLTHHDEAIGERLEEPRQLV